jgi:hypothetical protein
MSFEFSTFLKRIQNGRPTADSRADDPPDSPVIVALPSPHFPLPTSTVSEVTPSNPPLFADVPRRASFGGIESNVSDDLAHVRFSADGARSIRRGLSSAQEFGRNSNNRRQSMSLPASEKQHLQDKLNFSKLIRSPLWVLGFIVFALGNALNVVALQFAAQSLVAPLGSISLVVNVIVAPWLNNETRTIKDIIGVFLIVGGSAMVVVFAGSSAHDYCLRVILQLLKTGATIVFLTLIALLIFGLFSGICIVEKNLDIIPEADPSEVQKTLENGKLVSVELVTAEKEELVESIVTEKDGLFVTLSKSTSPTGTVRQRYIVASTSEKDEEADSATIQSFLKAKRASIHEEDKNVTAIAVEYSMNATASETSATSLEAGKVDVIPETHEKKRNLSSTVMLIKDKIKSIKLVPRLKNKFDLKSPSVLIFLPFAYASLGVFCF